MHLCMLAHVFRSCVEFLRACKNFDEAFGVVPGAESHAGQTFCCVAALKILGRLEKVWFVFLLAWL
jgi:geranylgeranyl transferase type-2 subunit beta